jgi:hypothetical protein
VRPRAPPPVWEEVTSTEVDGSPGRLTPLKPEIHRVDPEFGSTLGLLYRDFQSNCWVNLRILGQPCEFYLPAATTRVFNRGPPGKVCHAAPEAAFWIRSSNAGAASHILFLRFCVCGLQRAGVEAPTPAPMLTPLSCHHAYFNRDPPCKVCYQSMLPKYAT